MDAKDLRIETALGERNDGSKYSQSGVAVQSIRNKPYQDIGSNPLAKAEATVRPCAVIGPDRVVPPPASNEAYIKNASLRAWSCPENAYPRPPEYPHKPFSNVNPLRNISPRQTFQENMPRIMVSPTYNGSKHANEPNLNGVQDVNTHTKNIKPTLAPELKYCDVPYSVNYLSSESKNIREPEMCVPSVNSPLTRSAPHAWHPSAGNFHPSRMYGAHDVYQYPQYPSCNGARPSVVPVPRPHRTFPEEAGYVYPESYYQDTSSVRYKPYPSIKERYPQARYDYISNYPNPFHPPPYLPPKYDLPSTRPHPYSVYPHLKFMESRVPESNIDGYQRPNQNFNMPIRNQIIHPSYPPGIGNAQSKVSAYADTAIKTPGKPAQFDSNKAYIDYENSKLKYTGPDYLANEMSRAHQVHKPITIPNYPSPGMHPMSMQQYHRKENTMKPYDYMPHFRHFEHPIGFNHSSYQTPQFSPSTIAISPTDSTNSADNHIQGTSQEDCGYVSQSSSASVRSMDSSISRLQSEYYKRHEYRYQPITGNPPNLPKHYNNSPNTKDNSKINVRQFLSMWNEGDDDATNNSKEVPKLTDPHNVLKGQETNKRQDQLYVLGLMNVPSEELAKYEHIQKVSKLPENIKGYNNIELLNQFEEVIESSKINTYKSTNTKEFMSTKERKNAIKRTVEVLPRPVSPLDVEAKISQSVIHKEVGCNFEIKPCSPKMLNVEIASPIQNIIGERVIEKVTNPLKLKPNSPMSMRMDGAPSNHRIQRHENNHMVYEGPSCKMIGSPFSSNSMDHGKTNYSLQDLETNSGVCLASLPRLDNEIELNFPEVNQQFINANKGDNNLHEKYSTNMKKDNLVSSSLNNNTHKTNLLMCSATPAEHIKQTENENYDNSFDKEIESNANATRKDSVIIENPENVKKYEEKLISCKKGEEIISTPMNLTQHNTYNSDKYDALDNSKFYAQETENALDFSRNKPDNDLPILTAYDDLTHGILSNEFGSDIQHKNEIVSEPYLLKEIKTKIINMNNDSRTDDDGAKIEHSIINANLKDIRRLKEKPTHDPKDNQIVSASKESFRKVIMKQKSKKSKKSLHKNETNYIAPDNSGNVNNIETVSIDSKELKQKPNFTNLIDYHDSTDDDVLGKEAKEEVSQGISNSIPIENQTNISDCIYDDVLGKRAKEEVSQGISNSIPIENQTNISDCIHSDSNMSNNSLNLESYENDKSVIDDDIMSESTANQICTTENHIEPNEYRSDINKSSNKYYSDLISVSELLLDDTFESPLAIDNAKNSIDGHISENQKPMSGCNNINLKANIDDEKQDSEFNDKITILTLTDNVSHDLASTKNEFIEDFQSSDLLHECSADKEGSVANKNNNITHVSPVEEKESTGSISIASVASIENSFADRTADEKFQDTGTSDKQLTYVNHTDTNINHLITDKIDTLIIPNIENDTEISEKEPVINEFETINIELASNQDLISNNSHEKCENLVEIDIARPHINKIVTSDDCLTDKSNNTKISDDENMINEKDSMDSEVMSDDNLFSHITLDNKCKDQINENNLENGTGAISNQVDAVNDSKVKLSVETQLKDCSISSHNTKEILTVKDEISESNNFDQQMLLSKLPQSDDIYDKVDANMQILFEPLYKELDKEKVMDDENNKCQINNFENNCPNDKTKLSIDMDIIKETCSNETVTDISLRGDNLGSKSDTDHDFSEDLMNTLSEETVSEKVIDYEINKSCIKHFETNLLSNKSEVENKDQSKLPIETNTMKETKSKETSTDMSLSGKNLGLQSSKSDIDHDFSEDLKNTPANLSNPIVDQIKIHLDDNNINLKENLNSSVRRQFNFTWRKKHFCPYYQNLLINNEGKIKDPKTIECILGAVDSDSGYNSEINVANTNLQFTSDTLCDESSSSIDIMPYQNVHDIIPYADSSIDKEYESNFEKGLSESTDSNDLIDTQDISFTYTNCSIISQITEKILDRNDVVEHCNVEELKDDQVEPNISDTCNDDKGNITSFDAKNRRLLKRSLSDSALNKPSHQSEHQFENLHLPWPAKRNKMDGFANLQNNRRNSVNFEENVSFCILIDEDCIITEDNDEKICIAELQGNYIATEIDTESTENSAVPSNELISSVDINSELLECEKENFTHEPWIDDIGCVETVYNDEVAENVVISAPTSPTDSTLEMYTEDVDIYENANTSSYADKVKLLHGEKMSYEDAQVVDVLYRTPHMDIMNKTLLYGDKSISGSDTNLSDDDQENAIESDDWKASPTRTPDYIDTTHTSSEFRLETPENKVNMLVKELSPLRTIDDYLDVSSAENDNDENISPKPADLGIHCTQDDTIHSCESTLDNVFDYKLQDHSSSILTTTLCTTSSSPEVSSTTSEEKNSSTILLKITNLNGSIVSQINEVEKKMQPCCKFTEKKKYSASNLKFPNRPLMTKAAQKYIPPIKESIHDLKVSITLPQQRLLKLKQLKLCQNELKPKFRQQHAVIPRLAKKPKPNFDDVLKSIDELQYKKHKEKSKKSKSVVPKVIIKKSENGSHYASTPSPDLTGRKWQPWVFLEKNIFIDKMATRNSTRAIFSHRKNAYILAEKFKKYKSVSSTKFIISHPKSSGELKYTIRLKHAY